MKPLPVILRERHTFHMRFLRQRWKVFLACTFVLCLIILYSFPMVLNFIHYFLWTAHGKVLPKSSVTRSAISILSNPSTEASTDGRGFLESSVTHSAISILSNPSTEASSYGRGFLESNVTHSAISILSNPPTEASDDGKVLLKSIVTPSAISILSNHSTEASENYSIPLSLHCNLGRLGNQMCTYATLYGLTALNYRRRFVPLTCNTRHLKAIFVGPSNAISVDVEQYPKTKSWKLLSYLKPEDAAIPPSYNFLNGYLYPCSYTFFDHVKDEIRREFQFQDNFTKYAQEVLLQSNIHNLDQVTYIGVHVRRGDYQKRWLDAFEGVPVNMEYFRQAFHYFRAKYEHVIFIAVSQDRDWCIKYLSKNFSVYVPDEAPSPAHDLAILASCNHTVLTYGTFGFWGAYLAGGDVVYFDKFLKPNTTFTKTKFLFDKMYLPQWKGIVTIDSSYWLKNQTKIT